MAASVNVTVSVRSEDGKRGGSVDVRVPLRTDVLFGAACLPYPDSEQSWAQSVYTHIDTFGGLPILRSYDGGQPLNWQSKGGGSGSHVPSDILGWPERASWPSTKPDLSMSAGEVERWLVPYLESIPVTGHKRLLTMWHEPEAKIGKWFWNYAGDDQYLMTPARWKRKATLFGEIVRQVNHPDVLYGPVFMSKFTMEGKPHYVREILSSASADLFSVCDFIGWDPYNEATKSGDYSKSVEYYFDPVLEFSAEVAPGLPIAIGETGFINDPNNPLARAHWLTDLADYAEANDFLACCYFDASLENPWWLATDDLSIAAWSEVYAR